MKEGVDKKGQQMTLGTIIMIVLGITVLVFLIYGFSVGWGNLWDRVTNIGGTNSNVDTIKQSCALACQTGGANSHDYSTLKRTVKTGDPEEGTFTATCASLSKGEDVDGNGVSVSVAVCT